MPYSGKNDPNLPANVQEMPAADREQWVEVFNAAYDSCISDGGTSSECETSAFKQANGVIKKKSDAVSLRTVFEAIKRFFGMTEKRALGLPDLYNQVAMAAYEDPDANYAWLIDVYLGAEGMFAIFSSMGHLYKATVSVDLDTNKAEIPVFSEWEEVKEEYVPVSQAKSSFKIRAQSDGSFRWFLIAGTTILNRNAQIDSSDLFDSMVAKCRESDSYPYLTFFHLGEAFKMGKCDFVDRDGVALLASGVFDDSKLARSMIKAYEAEPDYWGSSIGFYAEEPEMVEIAQDIKLPVYNDGEWIEISILPEKQACAIMTALRSTKEVNRMEKRVEDAIRKLAGEDEDLATEFVSMVDDVNRTVQEQGMIHRSSETEPEVEEEAEDTVIEDPEPTEDPAPPEPESVQEIEIDQELVDQIAEKVLAGVKESIKGIKTEVEQLAKDVLNLHGVQIKTEKELSAKIEKLSQDEEEKKLEWERDASSKVINKARVTFRPTQRTSEKDAEEEAPNFAEIASETVSKLK